MTGLAWPDRGLTILHKNDHDSYQRWCGPAGIQRAAALGATAIDIDVNLAKGGLAVANHWATLKHHGFAGPGPRDINIANLTYAEIRQFRSTTKDAPDYRIWSIDHCLQIAGSLGIVLCLEAKGDRRFADPEIWQRIAHSAIRYRAQIVGMTIDTGEFAAEKLKAMRTAGVPNMLLARHKVDLDLATYLDAVKNNRPAWVRHLPDNVRLIGSGPGTATRWGAGCRPGNVKAARKAVTAKRAGMP
jgi:glycerophosphoryl diester phosphodiesterase